MVVMLYVRFPLSLRNVKDLLFEASVQHTRGLFDPWGGQGSIERVYRKTRRRKKCKEHT